jgi:hypothetical protein
MANIDKLQRQQDVKWPEFNCETRKGEADTKRSFQMFATDISRLGYTDKGRIFSIICPQQGTYSPAFGTHLSMNSTNYFWMYLIWAQAICCKWVTY